MENWQDDSEFLKAYGMYDANRKFSNIEDRISVREDFTRQDYEAFRPNEADPKRIKDSICICNDLYYQVGVVKNIIDLMADFAGQGLTIVHEDKKIEKFYRNWYKKVKGRHVTERFFNYFYRMANVIINRSNAKIKRKEEMEFKKISAKDYVDEIPVYRREIPWSYEFLNPIAVDLEVVNGIKKYFLKINTKIYNSAKIDNNNTNLPSYVRDQIAEGKKKIELQDDFLSIHYYKKDDWLPWAIPMITPIIKDIRLLDKMKLADNAAIDGTMSQIRLWTVGSLEHKIPPSKVVIEAVRNAVASGQGGGPMDLVWGPELSFKESSSDIYKFLGNEKYIPVLNNIYMGFGVSAAMAGAGANGGYTNNFVSIKTLIERLEYGREIVTDFWDREFEIVAKAMGFKQPAWIHFDSIILSDEAAIKNLLINLVDRNIISEETLLERFREIPQIEKTRIAREHKARTSDPEGPQKASPYHDPMTNDTLAQTALNSGNLAPEYFERKNIPFREAPETKKPAGPTGSAPKKKPKKTSNPAGGRPINTRDTKSRKQRRVIPRAKSSIDSTKLLWAINSQSKISDFITPIFLASAQKKNVRSLNKEEFDLLEEVKLKCFLSFKTGDEVTEESVARAAQKDVVISDKFYSILNSKLENFTSSNGRMPNIEECRTIYATIFAENN